MNESDLPCIQSETQTETHVFDGIKLTFENESNASGSDKANRILEIRHCKSGRAEFLTGDGFIYLCAVIACESVTANEAPDGEAAAKCVELGKKLAG